MPYAAAWMVPTSSAHRPCRDALFDVHPQSGASIEVFYADRTMETFGGCGAGWFWWSRRRGFSPDGPATGPFATSYAAYRNAIVMLTRPTLDVRTLGEQRAAFMCHACDMEQPTYDNIGLESLVFASIF